MDYLITSAVVAIGSRQFATKTPGT